MNVSRSDHVPVACKKIGTVTMEYVPPHHMAAGNCMHDITREHCRTRGIVRCKLDGLVEAIGSGGVPAAQHLGSGDHQANVCGCVDDLVGSEATECGVDGDICNTK